MSDQNHQTAIDYLQQRLSEIYGTETAERIAEQMRSKTAQLREDSELPMQNSVNKLIYPFLSGLEAMGLEGIPAEEGSPILMKLWEEMPQEIKLSGLNTDV